MNRSQSRFVPHGRPAYPAHAARKHTPAKKQRRSGKGYWFPIVTMLAAILFTVSAVMPRSVFSAFAETETEGTFALVITSQAGAYNVLLNGDFGPGEVQISPNVGTAIAYDNADYTVNVLINMSGAGSVTITTPQTMTSVKFGTGASNITDLDLDASGTSSLDISGCTALTQLDFRNNYHPVASHANEIVYGTRSDFPVLLRQAGFEYHEEGETKGYLFDVPGAGDMEGQSATVEGRTIAKSGNKYFITFDDLDAAFADDNGNHICATNTSNSGVIFITEINRSDFNEFIEATTPDSDTPDSDTPDSDTPGGDTTGGDTTGGDTTGGDTGDGTYSALTIDDGSKSIIKSASIKNAEGVDATKLKVVAKALSKTDKNNFVSAIKKADKNFKEADPALFYNIYVVDSAGKTFDVKANKSALNVVLAYPSNAVEYNREEYTYKVYHQLADKSIDTSINPSATGEGIGFITDSCSNFAVSCSAKEQNYTNIPIVDDSKGYAGSARAHEGTTYQYEDGTAFTGTGYKVVVEKIGDKDKKTFLAAVKAADKDFNDSDANLLVYDIYLVDSQSKKLELASGKVDVTLKYPNKTVEKNYSKFTHKVYHQLADGIDTKQLAVGGKDGITITSTSFSYYAITSTRSSSGGSDNPGTGDSSVAANIAMLLALLSMVSFAGVYAKNKAEQY